MVLPSSLSSFRPLAVLSTSLRGSAGSRLVATAASAAQPLVLHRHLLRRPLTSSPPVDRRAQIDHGPRFSNIRRSPREILATPQRPPPRNDDDVLVEVPDDPHGVLQGSTAEIILSNAALIVTRQIEFLNVFAGFEQANRYAITNEQGQQVGFIAEEDQGLLGTMSRQFLKTRRPFRAVILDLEGQPILWIRRPFQIINSKIYIHAQAGRDAPLVGLAQQVWHPLRRKYDLFLARRRGGGGAAEGEDGKEDEGGLEYDQFASVDEPLLSWEFWLKGEDGRARASVSRNFGGFGREIFTDTGTYVLRFDAVNAEIERIEAGQVQPRPGSVEVVVPPLSQSRGLTLDERAIALALGVSVDFDYFSRHSGHGGSLGMMMPFGLFGGGSELGGGSAPPPPPVPSNEEDQAADSPSAQLPPNMRDDDLSDLEDPSGHRDPSLPARDDPWAQEMRDDAEEPLFGDRWGGGGRGVDEGEAVWGEGEEGDGWP